MKATAGSFRGLIAAVVNRSLADLEKTEVAIKTSPAVKDEAMAWINSPECEAFCDALDMDYTAVREKAAALYRRFLEEAGGREKAPWKPRCRRKKIQIC
ncbi:MAG: hypothetical protein LBK62_00440 [Treponema sp.]|jgi:hypothetical protein|nr:hypothetical protein [Treponema sp.]